ncbi:N-acetylmuramoyl-L-alanine amidase-like domain-containing protein [Dysgonomonas sp. 520]|uniref:N-acetylmuramoyl-L-alanine amidase-like domain-containing protein n=1 Tax=Dysgonomonas sp. 520 TaxID=2302931 RepID=UPI0013D43B3B|nr:N-acetylmuramoyl-L-alanine amidase-like domain-containing protein [Dysgonomonas sp. 520]NDW08162.1 DUF1460 domain-containing protein [Dysgonomonas sp. 520]
MKIFKQIILSAVFVLISAVSLSAQVEYTKADSLIFEKYKDAFAGKQDLPLSALITETALFFRGTPYVSNTLEKTKNDERLTVNLRELDCTTLVENCIALSQTIKSGNASFENYCSHLQQLRYRDGIVDGYSSRLHYSSDWMMENEKRNLFENISQNLGGAKIIKTIDYMTTHTSAYRQLKNNPEEVKKIKKNEKQLNKRGGWYVINKQNIADIGKEIKNGDIILFSTTIKGLDFSHMGIAYSDNGRVTFIHASSTAKKVTIEKHSLSQYCLNSGRCNGIALLRVK